jgi:pilus assembly protein CpaB
VRVLAVDQTASESQDNPQVARAVTIEVTPEDGQKVALAGQIGTLSLALRRADEAGEGTTATGRQDTIRINDLRAEVNARKQPAAPAPTPRRRTHGGAANAGTSMEIVRGFTTNHATVATE